MLNDTMIYYMVCGGGNSNTRLVISDIFDKSVFYTEIERDFAPVQAIESINLKYDNTLCIRYYTADDKNRDNAVYEEIKLS